MRHTPSNVNLVRIQREVIHLAARVAMFLPIVGLLALVNFRGYSVTQFAYGRSNSLEIELGKLLALGNVITFVDEANWALSVNTILTYKEYVSNMRSSVNSPDILVLGSSRSRGITPKVLTGTILNLSTPGATLDEQIGLYGMVRQAGMHPRTVIVNLVV